MRVSLALAAFLGLFLMVPVAAGQTTQSRCADCHFANPDAPGHLYDWHLSPHAQANVGCDSCHGGNPDTFERVFAHQGILRSTNPASPVHHVNLPQTCGACHTGPFVAFQGSRHFELLKLGDTSGPSCSTCHSPVAAHLPSPNRLQAQCSSCHGEGRPNARPDYPVAGRQMLEGIMAVRTSLREAQVMIRRVRDAGQRREFEEEYQQAEVPIIEAANAGHRFVFDALEERMETARRRTEALLDRLVNPAP